MRKLLTSWATRLTPQAHCLDVSTGNTKKCMVSKLTKQKSRKPSENYWGAQSSARLVWDYKKGYVFKITQRRWDEVGFEVCRSSRRVLAKPRLRPTSWPHSIIPFKFSLTLSSNHRKKIFYWTSLRSIRKYLMARYMFLQTPPQRDGTQGRKFVGDCYGVVRTK